MARLILMRHGQSAWNKENRFTGWVDIPLSEEGIKESIEGGKKLAPFPIDLIFTSSLIRSQMTAFLAVLHHNSRKVAVISHPPDETLGQWGKIHGDHVPDIIPIFVSSALNERMYGTLQGLNKQETAAQFGSEQVALWRRSFDCVPPGGESLKMTIDRALPYFLTHIVSALDQGKNVLVVAHGNSLRGIVMHLDHLSKEEVVKLEIATGEQIHYTYDKGLWKKELLI